jgi:hypothetical protein
MVLAVGLQIPTIPINTNTVQDVPSTMSRKETKRRIRELNALAKDRGVTLCCSQCTISGQNLFMTSSHGMLCFSCLRDPIPQELLEYAWLSYGLGGMDYGGCDEPF